MVHTFCFNSAWGSLGIKIRIMVTKNSHGGKNGLRNRGQWRFMQVPTSIFPTVFAVTQCQRLSCNRYVGPWGAMYWNSPVEISAKKTYIIEKQWRTLRKFRSVFSQTFNAKISYRLGSGCKQVRWIVPGKGLDNPWRRKIVNRPLKDRKATSDQSAGTLQSGWVQEVFDEFFRPVSGVGKRCQPGLFC